MLDVQNLKAVLSKAGLIPDILILGGWLYVTILFVVLIYYFLGYIKKILFGQGK